MQCRRVAAVNTQPTGWITAIDRVHLGSRDRCDKDVVVILHSCFSSTLLAASSASCCLCAVRSQCRVLHAARFVTEPGVVITLAPYCVCCTGYQWDNEFKLACLMQQLVTHCCTWLTSIFCLKVSFARPPPGLNSCARQLRDRSFSARARPSTCVEQPAVIPPTTTITTRLQ